MSGPPRPNHRSAEDPDYLTPGRAHSRRWLGMTTTLIFLALLCGPGLFALGPHLPQPANQTLAAGINYLTQLLVYYGPLICSALAFLPVRRAIMEIDRGLAPTARLPLAERVRGLALTCAGLSLFWMVWLHPPF